MGNSITITSIIATLLNQAVVGLRDGEDAHLILTSFQLRYLHPNETIPIAKGLTVFSVQIIGQFHNVDMPRPHF